MKITWNRAQLPVAAVAVLLAVTILLLLVNRRARHGFAPAVPQASKQEACPEIPASTVSAPAPAASQNAPVRTRMHNVLFHLTDTAAAHIENLDGTILATSGNEMPTFDDKNSYDVLVTSAKISISTEALTNLMNNFVFSAPGAPIKDISLTIEKGRLRIKGKLHAKGDLPFVTLGTLSVTQDGRLRIHTEKVSTLHVPMKGVMNLFGIELAQMVNTTKIPGMDTDKDDLLMDLAKLLPPPHIRGAVTAVSIENDAIVTTISGTAISVELPAAKGNYMTFRGGRLRFGKMTVNDADLSVIDLDPEDPLDWNQEHYKEQLVAGYSKITATFGLQAYVKDYAKLKPPQDQIAAK